MIYVLENPSDPYTFEADTHEIAAVMTCSLGGGLYGATPVDDADASMAVPSFGFGRGEDEWFTERFGGTFAQTMARIMASPERSAALAAAFRSVLFGTPAQRAEFTVMLALMPSENHAKARALHHDRRSSMNNIGARAWRGAGIVAAWHAVPQQTPTHD